MTATPATVTRFVLVATPTKGETYRVTVTGKSGEETFTGRYRGSASTGLRFVVDGKVVTRATAKIVKIEAEETHEVPAAQAPAATRERHADSRAFHAELAAAVKPRIAAPQAPTAEPQIRVTDAGRNQIYPVPAADSNEQAADVYDADPMVDGKHLSQMKFAEVMKLAQHYKTPGRGVARIGALREGVAKAIAAEAGRLVGAAS